MKQRERERERMKNKEENNNYIKGLISSSTTMTRRKERIITS